VEHNLNGMVRQLVWQLGAQANGAEQDSPDAGEANGTVGGGSMTERTAHCVSQWQQLRIQMGEMGLTTFRTLGGTKQKLKARSLLPQLLEPVTEPAVVLFLLHLQVSCIPTHASRHVIWEVVECELGLLLCGSDKGSGVGREGNEGGEGEWWETEDWAGGVLGIQQCTVLHKHNTEPLQQCEELPQGDVPIEVGLGHVCFECHELGFDPREEVCHNVCGRICEGNKVRMSAQAVHVMKEETSQAHLGRGSNPLVFTR